MENRSQPVAIVTGAGSGIGRAAACLLARNGYRLALIGRRRSPLVETGSAIGGDEGVWIPIAADLALPGDRARVVDETIEHFGRIDALVNNAALGISKPLGEISSDEINDLFTVNAIAPIDLVRLASGALCRARGCVVNIASMSMIDPFPGLGVYGCTKAALDGLTRAIAAELGDAGIKAYTVAPGAVETSMLRAIVSSDDLPTERTLSPQRVAAQIVACVLGACEEPSGSTIVMRSP